MQIIKTWSFSHKCHLSISSEMVKLNMLLDDGQRDCPLKWSSDDNKASHCKEKRTNIRKLKNIVMLQIQTKRRGNYWVWCSLVLSALAIFNTHISRLNVWPSMWGKISQYPFIGLDSQKWRVETITGGSGHKNYVYFA